ncbi:AMP-binding protein, partial [Aeromonas salmonicida]
GELEARANRLAHWLQAQGVTPGAAIGIQARRDVAFVIALLACWKAGAAYVPLDPAYPAERLAHILG